MTLLKEGQRVTTKGPVTVLGVLNHPLCLAEGTEGVIERVWEKLESCDVRFENSQEAKGHVVFLLREDYLQAAPA